MSTKRTNRWASNKQTADHLGLSEMTLWRWKRNPTFNFPPPVVIGNRELNDLDKVDAWMVSNTVSRVKKSEKEAA